MRDSTPTHTTSRQMMEAVRDACARAAARAYEDAGVSGLCAEGRWESAIEAIRHLNLETVVNRPDAPGDETEAQRP